MQNIYLIRLKWNRNYVYKRFFLFLLKKCNNFEMPFNSILWWRPITIFSRAFYLLTSRPFGYEQKEYSFAKSWGWDQRWTCLFISGLLQWSNSLFRGWEFCFPPLGRENSIFPTRTLVGKTLFSTPRARKQNFLPPKVYFWSNGHEIQILYLCRKYNY